MSTGLALESVVVRFGGVTVLDSLSFDLEAGAVTALIGPNGAGKTTLMNTISGVLRPRSGRVILGGKDVTRSRPDSRARLGLARTYQDVRPLRNLTVLENVMVGRLYGRDQDRSTTRARARSMELLEHVGLQDRSNVAATSISSGQQKLMDLARALAMNPSTLLMDEPLAALSRENQLVVLDAARRLADAGGTVLIVEHILSSLLDYAERLMVVDRGALIADGKPREVVQATHVVDAYLGTAPNVVSEVGK